MSQNHNAPPKTIPLPNYSEPANLDALLIPAALPQQDLQRQALWDIYRILGFDTDGDATPAAVVCDLGTMVVEAAKEHRAEHDELIAQQDQRGKCNAGQALTMSQFANRADYEAAVLADHPPAAPETAIERTAQEIAAQVWCRDDCKHIEMDATLAFAFADVLAPYLADHPPAQDTQTFKCAMCAICEPQEDTK